MAGQWSDTTGAFVFSATNAKCRHLSLSTNNIEKISSLTGMENLKTLSLGRNCIKKIENLDGIADTLEELWISYNNIEKLVGIDKLANLTVLFMANNKVKDWAEVDRLSALEKLEDLLLRGCPIYDEHKDAGTLSTYRIEVSFCLLAVQHGSPTSHLLHSAPKACACCWPPYVKEPRHLFSG